MAGPYCTLCGWSPPFAGGESGFFLGLNRGKRGISIDLKQSEGLEVCLRLIDRTDLLIENFRPGAMGAIAIAVKRAAVGGILRRDRAAAGAR